MTKQERQERAKRRQLIRLAVPAGVCLVAVVAVVLGTKAWQGFGQAQAQPMELRGQWLGMRLATPSSRVAADLGVPGDVKGVVIADVQVSSRAVLAGLAPGDVVTRVDGKDVSSLMDLYSLTTKLDVARQLQVDILRAGRPMVVLVPPPEGATPAGATPWGGARPLGGTADNAGWGGNPRPSVQ